MYIKFGLYDTPRPKGYTGKKMTHARLLPKDTKQLDQICKYINEVSSLNSADVKGALEAFFQYLSLYLQDGSNIELEGIGIFSVALKSKTVTDENGKKRLEVYIDGVNFRCSERLKKELKKARLEKVKTHSSPFPKQDERKNRMLTYLNTCGSINRNRYAALNGCTYYQATKDLDLFVKEGIIAPSGIRTHKVYLLTEQGEMDTTAIF